MDTIDLIAHMPGPQFLLFYAVVTTVVAVGCALWARRTDPAPPGFQLDNAEAPGSFNANDVVKYDVSLGMAKDEKTMVYKRNLKINGMVFPVNSYPALKQVFDLLHKQDNHQVTLKTVAASAANK